jgi:hypothetical protein
LTELFEVLQQQKANILDIASHYHAANIRVFGSVVKSAKTAILIYWSIFYPDQRYWIRLV